MMQIFHFLAGKLGQLVVLTIDKFSEKIRRGRYMYMYVEHLWYFLTWPLDFSASQCCFNTFEIIIALGRGQSPGYKLPTVALSCAVGSRDALLAIMKLK